MKRLAATWTILALLGGCGTELETESLRTTAKTALSAGDGLGLGTTVAKPNIIVFMADDLDMNTYQTALNLKLLPNIKTHVIDRGVTFSDNFVTNSLCCPSRATFLTGQYSHNHGVLAVNRPDQSNGLLYFTEANGEINTLPVWMQNAGYRTGLIGKYLNGYGNTDPKKGKDNYVPPGYDEWHGLRDLANESTYKMYGYSFNDNGKPSAPSGSAESEYQTDVVAKKAAQFVVNSAGTKPFFLYVTATAPHVEAGYEYDKADNLHLFDRSIQPPPRYKYLVDSDPSNGELPLPVLSSSVFETDFAEKPFLEQTKAPLTDKEKTYIGLQYKDRLGALMAVDDLVGTTVASLKAQGKYDNTVIVFTSDNGWFYGEHHLGNKSWAYEESIRIPLTIGGAITGRGTTSKIVTNVDLPATIVDIGGAKAGRTLDGRSMTPILADPAGAAWKRVRLFVESFLTATTTYENQLPQTFGALRELSAAANDLYVHYFSQAEALAGEHLWTERYDLRKDPAEVNGWTTADSIHELRVQAMAKCSGASCYDLENDTCGPGWINDVTFDAAGQPMVRGWAQDILAPAAGQTRVDLFIGGKLVASTEWGGSFWTSAAENDQCGVPGAHNFSIPLRREFAQRVHEMTAHTWAGGSYQGYLGRYTSQGVPYAKATRAAPPGQAYGPKVDDGRGFAESYVKSWWDRFNIVRNCTLQDKNVVAPQAVFLGDATTQLWGDPRAARGTASYWNATLNATKSCASVDGRSGYQGYDEFYSRFDEKGAGFDGRNAGISGGITDTILYQLNGAGTNATADADGLGSVFPIGWTPKVVVLNAGSLNLSYGDAPNDVVYGIRSIIALIHARSPATKILLLGLLPRSQAFETAACSDSYASDDVLNKLVYSAGGNNSFSQKGVNTQLAEIYGKANSAGYSLYDPLVRYYDVNLAAGFMTGTSGAYKLNQAKFNKEGSYATACSAAKRDVVYAHLTASGYADLRWQLESRVKDMAAGR